jgi:hypothetical protein
MSAHADWYRALVEAASEQEQRTLENLKMMATGGDAWTKAIVATKTRELLPGFSSGKRGAQHGKKSNHPRRK